MEKHFNCPLSLIQFIKDDNDKDGLIKIIAFGSMNFSEKMNFKKNSVANQIIYLYYRNPYSLDKKIKKHLDEMIEDGRLTEDEDYHGFAGDTFMPEQENEDMLKEFESNKDFYSQCVNAYREHQAFSLLNLNQELKPHLQHNYKEVKKFIDSFQDKNGPDAWTSIPINMIFEVYNGTLSMDYLRLIAAVKSVLNKKNFNLTYKSVLMCRLFGCKKMKILNELFIENPELRVKHAFLSRRRQWEKLIDSAMEKGYFSYYCTGRQFFVSITMTKEELQNAIEKRQKDYSKIKITA